MSTTYPSDLSDAEWASVPCHLPSPPAQGKPPPTRFAASLTPSLTLCGAGEPGGICRATFLPGRPCSTPSADFAYKASGICSTQPCTGRTGACGPSPRSKRCHSLQPKREDGRGVGGHFGARRAEMCQVAKAPSLGRHTRPAHRVLRHSGG